MSTLSPCDDTHAMITHDRANAWMRKEKKYKEGVNGAICTDALSAAIGDDVRLQNMEPIIIRLLAANPASVPAQHRHACSMVLPRSPEQFR